MDKWSRRGLLTLGAGASVSMFLRGVVGPEQMQTKPIPSTGEQLPVIGLGSASTFSAAAGAQDIADLREVMRALVLHGGKVLDTAPAYGSSEEVAGRIASGAALTSRIFWSTKVNVAPTNGHADPAIARAELETSAKRIRKRPIDLIQVHNLGDLPVQLKLLKDWKAQGRVRYIGVTTTMSQQYDDLVRTMKSEPLDFIGVNYAVDDRHAEDTILPLAHDRGIAVLAYMPFGRTRLFRRAGNRPLPDWAAAFDAKTWAQFFLKYVVSHPSVNAATPATSKVKDMLDNVGACFGRLPDEATRKRIAAFVDALPVVA